MRLRACMGSLLFFATGCTGLPERLRIEADDRMIEVRQQGFDTGWLKGRWSSSLDCSSPAELPPQRNMKIRSITPDELEIQGVDGVPMRLYRCSR